MDNIDIEKQKEIVGGGISTLLNSMVKVSNFILELGRSLGSSISRMRSGKYCR